MASLLADSDVVIDPLPEEKPGALLRARHSSSVDCVAS